MAKKWDNDEHNLVRNLMLEDKGLEISDICNILKENGYERSENAVRQRRTTIYEQAHKTIRRVMRELKEAHKLLEIKDRNGNSKEYI